MSKLSSEKLSSEEQSMALSTKLLKGWKMLKEECVIGNCPLMQEPGTLRKWSAALDDFVDNHPSIEAPIQPSVPEALNDIARTHNEQSQALSQKLLAGWDMLDEVCPITGQCPLMQEPTTNRKWSAAINDFVAVAPPLVTDYKYESSVDFIEKPSVGTSLSKTQKHASATRVRVGRNQMFKDVAHKMTLGWLMLEEGCPVTDACPLMEEPTTLRQWSAALAAFVDELYNGDFSQELTTTHTAKADTNDADPFVLVPRLSTVPQTKSRNEQSKAISVKLLTGWAMLDESCPVTGQCPLVQEPKTKRKWSAALDGFIDEYQSNNNTFTSAATAVPPPLTTATTHQIKSRDEQSKATAVKLLAGWAMLDESCPVTSQCPLMQEPNTKRKWSAALDGFVDEYQSNNKTPTSTVTAPPTTLTTTDDSTRQIKSRDDQSKAISVKLVAGWAMLDESCPVTGQCPLMQEPKTKRKWSAALGEFVDEYQSNNNTSTSAATAVPPLLTTADDSTRQTKSRDEQSKATAVKLLAGWAMLDESCPVTGQCPLMQEPKTKRKWSAALDGFVDEHQSNNSTPTSAATVAPQRTTTTTTDDARQTKSRDEQSKAISVKLVAGWAMLDESCPVTGQCPLMQEPNTKRKWSAALDGFVDEYQSNINTPTSTASAAPPPLTTTATDNVSQTKSRDEQSKATAAKLLAGWAMLDESCPVTGQCPLMQEPKTKRKWSAALDGFVDEYQSNNITHTSAATATASSTSPSPSPSPSPPTTTTTTTDNMRKIKSRDEQSNALSAKMLLGWDMLDESCPVTCQCPLMQEPKTKRKWSAALDDFVDM